MPAGFRQRVVHLSHTDSGAGAGRAAYRIHRALLGEGIDSSMIVGHKRTSDDSVIAAAGGGLRRLRARGYEYLEAKCSKYRARKGGAYVSLSTCGYFAAARDPCVRAADIVCLYWINGGFIRPEGLAGLSQPIVWRLSDVWPFSGGCHYPGGCDRFVVRCGECPQLSVPRTEDRSRQLWERKARAWQRLDFTIVAPTRWIADLAARSSLFGNRRIEIIPTGVDLLRYRPQDQRHARELLGVPVSKDVILFVSNDILGDTRKGYGDLLAALKEIAADGGDKYHVLLVGAIERGALSGFPLKVTALGRLSDDHSLNLAYASSDLVVCPSSQDNLPNTALEAIACGIPVVGYDVGGMRDIVDHQRNGFLAYVGSITELANGIRWVLEEERRRNRLRQAAREKAEATFSMSTQAKRYISLFQELTQGKAGASGNRATVGL